MREIGLQGGKIGGNRSLETMTPKGRAARAKKVSQLQRKRRTAARLAWENALLRHPSHVQRRPVQPRAQLKREPRKDKGRNGHMIISRAIQTAYRAQG
jgi:hypothetical protein